MAELAELLYKHRYREQYHRCSCGNDLWDVAYRGAPDPHTGHLEEVINHYLGGEK